MQVEQSLARCIRREPGVRCVRVRSGTVVEPPGLARRRRECAEERATTEDHLVDAGRERQVDGRGEPSVVEETAELGGGRMGKDERPNRRPQTVAAHEDVGCDLAPILEAHEDLLRTRTIDRREPLAEAEIDASPGRLFREEDMEPVAPDHRERPAELLAVAAPVDEPDRPVLTVRERECAARMAMSGDDLRDPELVEHVHPVGRHPEERALSERGAVPRLREDDLDADLPQPHRQHRPTDPGSDDDRATNAMLSHPATPSTRNMPPGSIHDN